MVQNFIIKEGKKSTINLIGLVFFLMLYLQSRSYVGIPLMLIAGIVVFVDMIMFFRWTTSFAVFLDMGKQEIILNHSLFFRKKRISLKDIKEIDTLNGAIILFASTHLSKCQKMVSKTNKSNDYTIRLSTIETSERRELIRLLCTLKSEE